MNYIEFKRSVLCTWKQEDLEPATMHAFMGITSELGELFESHNLAYHAGHTNLDLVNVWEELGDLSYYLAMLDNLHNLNVDALRNDGGDPESKVIFLDALALLGQYTGEIADVLKKHYKYGQSLNVLRLAELLGVMFDVLCSVSVASGRTLELCMSDNIDKLRKRYPDGFSELDAKNRMDKQDA